MQRPRLAERVIARSQVQGARTHVALHDPQRRTIHVVGAREWTVLACADGTRDLAGIAAAAARLGVQVSVARIAEFFATLAGFGWLCEGAPAELLAGEVSTSHASPADRRVVEMPGSRVLCDGSGGCCRAYASVVFLPADVHAAELAAPEQGSDTGTRFLPVHGSAPTMARAVGLVDGACAFLDAANRCTIHARLGFDKKPLGCRWYPARVYDDGVELRVAPAIECLCVARPSADGDPLVPAGIDVAGDLPVGISVASVPAAVALAHDRVVDRAAALAIADAIADAVPRADAIGWLWALADALERGGAFDVQAYAPMPASALAEASARWARAANERCAAENVWRSSTDAVCVRLQTLATAATLTSSVTAAEAVLASAPDDPALEAHVVRAGAWGRSWLAGPPLAEVLRDHAIAFALARAVAAFVPDHADGTLRGAPLAAVLALRRTCLQSV